MGIFLGILISYFSLGYASLQREINATVGDQTPLIRERKYLLYILIWPLPLLVNIVLVESYVRHRNKKSSDLKVKEAIQAFKNSFGYGQLESILIALWIIATKFKTVKAHPGEVYYIEKLKKLFGIVPFEDEIYRQMMSSSIGNEFMIYLNQMSNDHKEYFCAVINEMLEGNQKQDADKANVASAILNDIGVTKEQYRNASSKGNSAFMDR